jgi:hypothetical protein
MEPFSLDSGIRVFLARIGVNRMRRDQLARERCVVRPIDSPNALAVAELAGREKIGITALYRDPEALQAAGFFLYTKKVERSNRWVSKYLFFLL